MKILPLLGLVLSAGDPPCARIPEGGRNIPWALKEGWFFIEPIVNEFMIPVLP